jgi:RNA recognition motif-containing protein
MMTLFVSNWPWSTDEAEIRKLFSEYGPVGKITIPWNHDRNRPQGYAFVQMDPAAGERAMAQLEGVDWGGRELRVRKADDRPRRYGRQLA